MNLLQLLRSLDPSIDPADCKIHLAGWNGSEDPLHVYFDGKFDEWQAWQTRRNFERGRVVSLIALHGAYRWLFAGTHDALGSEWHEDLQLYRYQLRRRPETDQLDGRLVVEFKRTGRQSYLVAERWIDAMEVAEIRSQRLSIGDFPGYAKVSLSKPELDIVVAQALETWRSALSSVGGVYVIADQTSGKLYGSCPGLS